MADGCICNRKKSQPAIRIQLKSDDEYILKRFKQELNSSNNISFYSKRKHSEFRIHSIKMAKDLSKYGIIPNKTGKEIFPIDKIPYNMYPHFLRGFFDGDG